MADENRKDRHAQQLAAYQYERHLQQLGVTQLRLIETPEHRRLSYDYEIREGADSQLWTGVLEVKCRDQKSDDYTSALVEIDWLEKMKAQFYHTSEITGKKFWSKNVVYLCHWKDDVCHTINIMELIKNWDHLLPAPEGAVKDGHGERPAERSGAMLIPFDIMERFT